MPDKQALKREHRAQVDCPDSRRFRGSVDLDTTLRSQHPGSNRWDYGLGFSEADTSEVAIWVEVHPAQTSDVDTFLAKLDWLRAWLRNYAPALAGLSQRAVPGAKSVFWVATDGVHIRPGTPQARRLQQVGIDLPRQRLTLT